MDLKLAERLTVIKARVADGTSQIDMKAFTASFAALLVLTGSVGFKIVSDYKQALEHSPPKGLNTDKLMAEMDVSQHIDEPIKHIENNNDMTATPLQTGDTATAASIKSTDMINGLFEETPFGQVPIKRASDKMTVFEAYKMPFTPQDGTKGIISIVMVDYGLSDKITAESLSHLPPAVSVILSPYAASIQEKLDQARSYGHEVWLDMPIQTGGYGIVDDTGPLTLLSGLNPEQNNNRLLRTLSLAHGYVGVALSNTPDFKESESGLKDIFMTLSARGLALANTAANDEHSHDLAKETSLLYVTNSGWISADNGEEGVKKAFEHLESVATQNFYVVAFITPQPKLLSMLKEWDSTLSAKGIQLAPLSTALLKSKDF